MKSIAQYLSISLVQNTKFHIRRETLVGQETFAAALGLWNESRVQSPVLTAEAQGPGRRVRS